MSRNGGQEHSRTYQSSTQTSLTSIGYFSSTIRGYPWAEVVARNTRQHGRLKPSSAIWVLIPEIWVLSIDSLPANVTLIGSWAGFPFTGLWFALFRSLLVEVIFSKGGLLTFENRESTTRNRLKEFAVVKLNYRCPAVNRIVFKMNNTGSSTWVVGFCSASTHKW